MVQGYNIAFKVGGKTYCGRTQDELNIDARIIESLDKDDQGETRAAVSGHDVTFSASGTIVVGNTESTKQDRDALIAQALLTGNSAELTVTYLAANGSTYGGTAIITNYRETSNASDPAQWSANFRIVGTFAIVS